MVREAFARGLDRLDDTTRVELALHHRLDVHVRRLFLIRLDTADEMRLRGLEGPDELVEARAEGVDDADKLGRLEAGGPAARDDLVCEEGGDELVVTVLHENFEILGERVLILLEESDGVVGHTAGVVEDGERSLRLLDVALKEGALGATVDLLDLAEEADVRAVGEEALLREQGEQARGGALDQLDNLRVVLKSHAAHVDALLLVLGEDRLEDGLGEHALELLVCKVDAQLLERVAREALEAKDVDGADEEASVAAEHERLVNLLDEHVEEARVEGAREGVLGAYGVRRCVWLGNPIQASLDVERADGLGQLLSHAAEQARRHRDRWPVIEACVVLARPLELGVAEVEDRREDFPHRLGVGGNGRDGGHRSRELLKVGRELIPLDLLLIAHVEVAKRLPSAHLILFGHLRRQARRHLIEHVIVLLVWQLRGDARLFKQISAHEGTLRTHTHTHGRWSIHNVRLRRAWCHGGAL